MIFIPEGILVSQMSNMMDIIRFVEEGSMKTKYAVIIGGQNFGCGSSREHAPVAIGAAGIHKSLSLILSTPLLEGSSAVIAESYARIFFRNCIAT